MSSDEAARIDSDSASGSRPTCTAATRVVAPAWLSSLLRRRVFWDVLWASIGELLCGIGMLVGIRWLTDVVDPAVYGRAALWFGVVMLLDTFTRQPLAHAATRFYPQMHDDCERYTLRKTAEAHLGVVIATFAIVSTIGACANLVMGGSSYSLLLAACSLLISQILVNFELAMLTAARRQRTVTLGNLARVWLRSICAVVLVWLFGSAAAWLLIGYLLSDIIALLIFRSGRDRTARPQAEQSIERERRAQLGVELRAYALPLVPAALFASVTMWSGRYIVGGTLGLEEVGVYAAAYTLIIRPAQMIALLIGRIMRPIYFDAFAKQQRKKSKRVFVIWLCCTTVTSLLLAAVCVFGAGWIVRLALAPDYRREAVEIIPWLAGGAVLLCIKNVLEQRMLANKQTRAVLVSSAITACAAVLLTFVLARYYGILGAAIACPIFFGIETLLLVVLPKVLGHPASSHESGDGDIQTELDRESV